MAETGLLIKRTSGDSATNSGELTLLLPWFDTSAAPQAARLIEQAGARLLFLRTGLRHSFKAPLAKILWLRDQGQSITPDHLWLSTPDFIAYRLTGQYQTDHSLATRTGAFLIESRDWDRGLLNSLGLSTEIFPPARPAGEPAGGLLPDLLPHLPAGIPVAVCGHDHICAAFAAGVLQPGQVFELDGHRKIPAWCPASAPSQRWTISRAWLSDAIQPLVGSIGSAVSLPPGVRWSGFAASLANPPHVFRFPSPARPGWT